MLKAEELLLANNVNRWSRARVQIKARNGSSPGPDLSVQVTPHLKRTPSAARATNINVMVQYGPGYPSYLLSMLHLWDKCTVIHVDGDNVEM